MLRQYFKALSRLAFKTPLLQIALFAFAISIAVGLLATTEPAFILRFRRSVHAMKLVPYLCRQGWVRGMADTVQDLGTMPSIALLVSLVEVVAQVMLFPVRIVLTGLRPDVLRSVLLLVGLPCGFLYACCKVPGRFVRRSPAVSVIAAWSATALTLGAASLASPNALRWAVSDISLPLYFALLATILTVSAVEERLSGDKRGTSGGAGTRVCLERLRRTALYLLGGVTALWVLRFADARRLSYNVLLDVTRVMGRNYKVARR